jgi:flagellar biogenesis protein FliO
MDIVRQSLAITFVLALLWGALWVLRRRDGLRPSLGKGPGQPRLLESRGKLALTAHHSVHVIRAGNREIVLGVHGSGITVICDLATDATAPSQPSQPK